MIDAKAYLVQVELYDRHINNKLEELVRLKELTRQITSTLKQDVVATSGRQDKLGEAIAKIIDLETEINDAVDAYIDKRREVISVIEKISDPDQVAVLYKRYCGYKGWTDIAKELHMSERNVQYIHGRALQSVRLLLANGGAE
jgi:DNA-directed RNA polymerase specialized sigma subunit